MKSGIAFVMIALSRRLISHMALNISTGKKLSTGI